MVACRGRPLWRPADRRTARGAKMKIYKAAVKALFTRSDALFDIEQIYDLGKQIG